MTIFNDQCDRCRAYLDPQGGNDCRAFGKYLICESCLALLSAADSVPETP